MQLEIRERWLTERTTVYDIHIGGSFLCSTYKRSNAEKVSAWLEEHGIFGKVAFQARPFEERLRFLMVCAGSTRKTPFDFLPWAVL